MSIDKVNTLAGAKEGAIIPLILHHIWLINPANPSVMREKDIANLKNTLTILDKDPLPWKHVLWTNQKEYIEKYKEYCCNR